MNTRIYNCISYVPVRITLNIIPLILKHYVQPHGASDVANNVSYDGDRELLEH